MFSPTITALLSSGLGTPGNNTKKTEKGDRTIFFFLNHLTMVALHGSAQLSEVKQTDLRRDNTS